MPSMHYAASVEHDGRRDKHGHLWTRSKPGPFWQCDDCGRRLHGVKVIWLDYECPVDKQVSCTERTSEPSIHLHETVDLDYWEQWAEDGDPLEIESLHKRLCRLERQRAEVRELRAQLEYAESRIARLENEWWLQRVDGGVWHSTTLERWVEIKKEKAITVRDDGKWSNGWQHDNGYVCVWDFRSYDNFSAGWQSGGKSFIQAQTEPGIVWIEIDVEAIANGDYLSPRDYGKKMDAGELMPRVILGCEGGIKERVDHKHWGRVELITAEKTWTTLKASIEDKDCPSCARTFRQVRQDLYGDVYNELKNVIGNNVDQQTERKILQEFLDQVRSRDDL